MCQAVAVDLAAGVVVVQRVRSAVRVVAAAVAVVPVDPVWSCVPFAATDPVIGTWSWSVLGWTPTLTCALDGELPVEE